MPGPGGPGGGPHGGPRGGGPHMGGPHGHRPPPRRRGCLGCCVLPVLSTLLAVGALVALVISMII